MLIGDSGTGKSSILARLKVDESPVDMPYTIGADFYTHECQGGSHAIRHQVWDIGNEGRYVQIVKSYYRGCRIVVIVFDVGCSASFDGLDKYYASVSSSCQENMPEILVIGNKCDLGSKRQVTQDEAEAWALKKEAFYLDYSAKEDSRAVIIAKLNEIVDKIMLNQ